MPWTRLQQALGERRHNLTFDMVERACTESVEEQHDLDWKSRLPLSGKDPEGKAHRQAELAKDIAAMANSGGGLIVYGVSEISNGGVSAANSIQPVGPISDSDLQQIRQVANSWIHPPVTGIELFRLAPMEDPTAGVLALVIPDSLDSPHLACPVQREQFLAPWRDGPHTRYMNERQLHQAYRQRDQAVRQRVQDLDSLWRSTIDVINAHDFGPTWVIAVAIPDRPFPRSRQFTIEASNQVFDTAVSRIPYSTLGPLQSIKLAKTGRGLRCYLRRVRRTISSYDAILQARVELHHSGAVTAAFARGGIFPPNSHTSFDSQVAICDLERVASDLLALILTAQETRGFRTAYDVRLGNFPLTQLYRRSDPHLEGNFDDFNERHRIHGCRPVDGTILANSDLESASQTCFELIEDAVHQIGVQPTLSPFDISPWLADPSRKD